MLSIAEIAKNLARKIPRPARKTPREQKSFAGLQVGQKLRLRPGQVISTPQTGKCSPGTTFAASDATSEGIKLVVVESPTNGPRGPFIGGSLVWTRREWEKTFEKAGRSK